ncbi:MAG TPA: hypothetical protein VIJ63_06890 [Roseiarcus sp.]
MSEVKRKPLDVYLRSVKCENIVPINGTWLKRSDKRADAAGRRGDAFEGSEKKLGDARK